MNFEERRELQTIRQAMKGGGMMDKSLMQPNHSISQKDSYTVQEIAEILGMKERTAYNYCNSTTDFKVKRIGRLIRINKQSFDEWWNG